MSDTSVLTSLSEIDYETAKEIYQDFAKNKADIEEYLQSKNVEYNVAPNPAIAYLGNSDILSILKEGLNKLLVSVGKADSYYKPKTTLNGIDYLAEYLYNMNPRFPDRKQSMTYIFDMDWVKEFLEIKPRPFYPFSLIWSEDFAARKIQAFYRGYLQRKQFEVQEVRTFWKNLDEKEKKQILPSDE